MELDQLTFATQARVTARAADSALVEIARQRAIDPSVFDTYPPFLWQNEISSDRLDSYYTIMDADTTLVNYAADAAAGVAVLIGHDTRTLPVGASLSGTLERLGEVARVLSDAYALIEPATESIVNRVKAGIARDISVGFSPKGAQCLCSICGRDMWRDWECWHIPGFEYEVTAQGSAGSTGAKVMQLATGRIVGAHLSEYSLVYDGATPGAAVLQAQRNAEAGRLTAQQARLIEQRYRIRMPDRRLVVPGAVPRTQENRRMDEQEVNALLERAQAPAEQRGLAGVQWLATELARLRPLAADGETYRADLINQAKGEAVRAFGAEAAETHGAVLESGSLALIRQLSAAWKAIGDAKLGGGRASQDGADGSEPETQRTDWQTPVLPAGLYQG